MARGLPIGVKLGIPRALTRQEGLVVVLPCSNYWLQMAFSVVVKMPTLCALSVDCRSSFPLASVIPTSPPVENTSQTNIFVGSSFFPVVSGRSQRVFYGRPRCQMERDDVLPGTALSAIFR